MNALTIINALAGLIVLAEALHCLERAKPFARGLTRRQYGAQALGILAWLALASSAAMAVADPLLSVAGPPICWAGAAVSIGVPPLAEVLLMVGAAGIVVRGWLE